MNDAMDEMDGMQDEESNPDLASLLDLLKWAQGGQQRDMASRYGKSMPGEEMAGQLPREAEGEREQPDVDVPTGEPSEAPIPGVEPEEPGTGESAAAGPDMEKLKAALARMKG